MPISFWSLKQNGQWSVETTASSFMRRPFQRSRWWCSCFVRSGVEHRMELLYQGVVNGELTLERWVETCSTTPARMFGLDHKGQLAPGFDADVLIWDPEGHTSIGYEQKHHMNMDHSAWEGFEVDGKVDTVLSRGTVVIENDRFVGAKGHGKFVKRGLSSYLT